MILSDFLRISFAVFGVAFDAGRLKGFEVLSKLSEHLGVWLFRLKF